MEVNLYPELSLLLLLLLLILLFKSRRLRCVRHVARMEEGRTAFKILTGTPAEKRLFGKSRHRWEGNIRMDFKEMGFNTRNWVDSAQDTGY